MLRLGNTEINALGNNINKAYLGAIEVFGNVFTSLWQTTTANETITLPTSTNYRVDWGDGTMTTNTNSHEYLTANQYTIKISGEITDFAFVNGGDKDKILEVSKYGNINLIDSVFYGCLNLNISATKQPNISESLVRVYRNCSSLIYNNSLDFWKTENVTDFSFMFGGSVLFNQPLNFSTESAVLLGSLLDTCENYNQPINFNTPNLTVTTLMMARCYSFNSSFYLSDTSKVINMASMFRDCFIFNQPLSLNLASCTRAEQLIMNCSDFNSSLILTNTGGLVNTVQFLEGCSSFNQPLVLDTSEVLDMGRMLLDCENFNQPINFNTEKVEVFRFMLYGCTSFNQPLAHLSFVSATNLDNFMGQKGPEYDVNYMDNLYIKLDQDLIFANMVNVNIGLGSINYTSVGATARASLVSKGFIITSGVEV